ncbi:MAG: FAD-dependent oxidoreductase [Proteobacteria bacterium]|nr:FAD-dependent oxidoreductase [Pseudomonadota bacterium]
MTHFDVLIVGAGHAGAQTAAALRQQGFGGSIGMVGEEAELPYERPALSKEYLTGKKSFERMLLRDAAFWLDRRIQILPGRRVDAVDANAQSVTLDDASELRYGQLVWATGGYARRLQCTGHDLDGVHVVRTRRDVDALHSELGTASRVAIVGGGFIGLECAAAISAMGKRVVVLEAQERLLARVCGREISRFFEREHRQHSVDFRLSCTVERLQGQNGRVTGLLLSSGEEMEVDLLIVGVGIVAAVDALLAAGAKGENGVVVDRQGRTSLPNVFAVGDCALHENDFASVSPLRIESVQNANDMATHVAKVMMGESRPYHAVPWFWSNQYDLRLQTVGIAIGHDREVLRGDPTKRSFTAIYLKDEKVIALDCVNATTDYVQGRKLVLARTSADPRALADTSILLKDLVAE